MPLPRSYFDISVIGRTDGKFRVGSPLAHQKLKRDQAMMVWIYVDTSKEVGDRGSGKNDPEGVAFEYEATQVSRPVLG